MNELYYFKAHPLRIPQNRRHFSVAAVCQYEKAYMKGKPDLAPAAGAYIHYGGVELADRISLAKPVLTASEWADLQQAWANSCGYAAKALLFYVWRICTGELRHGNAGKCNKAFGDDQSKWNAGQLLAYKVSTEGKDVFDNAHDVQSGLYVDAMEANFRKGGWSGAYGGKKWADITLQFQRYIGGEVSAMVAADRCWTLVHNTGPIFNKGYYFKHHDGNLLKVLNAQANSSVFALTDMILGTGGYAHASLSSFEAFKNRAVAALTKADPSFSLSAMASAATGAGHGGMLSYDDDDDDDDDDDEDDEGNKVATGKASVVKIGPLKYPAPQPRKSL